MEKLTTKHFEWIQEDNSEEEREKQWKRSKLVFDHFFEYLKNKGLKESTASQQTERAAYFITDYIFIYEDLESVLDIHDDTIRTFLGNWYIRKIWSPTISEIKLFLRAISNFFSFLKHEDFISKNDLKEIKEVCKDKAWFEMRLKTYFEAEGDDFSEWIEEYNYNY